MDAYNNILQKKIEQFKDHNYCKMHQSEKETLTNDPYDFYDECEKENCAPTFQPTVSDLCVVSDGDDDEDFIGYKKKKCVPLNSSYESTLFNISCDSVVVDAVDVAAVVVAKEEKMSEQKTKATFVRTMNREITYEMMPGFRFSSNVLYSPEEKQFYVRNSSSKIGVGYTCYIDACKSRVHVRDMKCYIGNSIQHNHEDKADMYINLSALNEMKRMLRSVNNRMTPKQAFDDVISR